MWAHASRLEATHVSSLQALGSESERGLGAARRPEARGGRPLPCLWQCREASRVPPLVTLPSAPVATPPSVALGLLPPSYKASCLPLIRPLVITRGPLDNPGSSPRLEILNVIHLQRPPATSGTRTCAPPGTILRSAMRGRLRPPRTCNAAGVLCGRSVQTHERPYRTGSWGRRTPTPRTCRASWLTWGLSQAPVLRLLARGADRSNPLWEQSRAPPDRQQWKVKTPCSLAPQVA